MLPQKPPLRRWPRASSGPQTEAPTLLTMMTTDTNSPAADAAGFRSRVRHVFKTALPPFSRAICLPHRALLHPALRATTLSLGTHSQARE